MRDMKEILDHIKEQTGADLSECDYFSGVRQVNGRDYVNLQISKKTSESAEFTALVRLSGYSSLIASVEPNGVRRVAVFLH